MKTLQQIIERNDYVRLTEQLRTRVEELATAIHKKMLQLNLNDTYNVGEVTIHAVSGRTNVASYEFLAIVDEESDLYRVIDGKYSGYIHGDFNHYYGRATNKQCLSFLNSSKEILDWLDRTETEQCNEITEALEKY